MTEERAESLAEAYNATLTKLDELNGELDQDAESLSRLSNWLKHDRDEIRFLDEGTLKRFEKREHGRVQHVSADERALGVLGEHLVARAGALAKKNELEEQLRSAGLDRLIRQKR